MATANLAADYTAVYNHLALPARVPGCKDAGIEKIAQDLLKRLIEATAKLSELPANQFSESYTILLRSLQSSKVVNERGKLDASSLLAAFRRLEDKHILILHVTAQNVGLLVRREIDDPLKQNSSDGDRVVFEAFEASALSEHVLAATTLEWDFPGCAVSVPYATFSIESFQSNLSMFLERASTECVKQFAAQAYKQSAMISENRDTSDPGLITRVLMPLLEVNGTRIFPAILRKRVRDEVSWADGSERPWRRCSFWLVLRVAAQRHLSTLLDGELGRLQYKFLICLVIVQFLEDSIPHLDLELSVFLKAKLCRRIAKLEADKDKVSFQIRHSYDEMFELLGPRFLRKIAHATQTIDIKWTNFKAWIRRQVGRLPRHADKLTGSWADDPPMVLSLPNSRTYLEQAIRYYEQETVLHDSEVSMLSHDFQPGLAIPRAMMKYMENYRALSEKERQIENDFQTAPESRSRCKARCIQIAASMKEYIVQVGNAYDRVPEQKSIMLLTLMEMWMSMDECAGKVFWLLRDYNPGFRPDILDVLQLSCMSDMKRLHRIRCYVRDRLADCKTHMTIFNDPVKGCFAERFYDESPDSLNLKALHERIEEVAEDKREEKKREMRTKNMEYEQLLKQSSKRACEYKFDDETHVRYHDPRCAKCILQARMNKMRIAIHEHPLPSNSVQAKSVIFELDCPEAFLKYREATWTLMGVLGAPSLLASEARITRLSAYTELYEYIDQNQGKKFKDRNVEYTICLASTKKSHLGTHYSERVGRKGDFPVSENDILRPHGMEYGFFDDELKVWPSRLHLRPTFAHHCELVLPRSSPLSSIISSMRVSINSDGPSSYEIIASQTKCPTGLNVHEFMALMSLFAGKVRRWPQILNELGSSNLNFSSETTTSLISSIVLQAGPPSEVEDYLGDVHKILRDNAFCKRLFDQLRWRLESISSNWRENNCMETTLTLLLRLEHFGNLRDEQASELLLRARSITLGWIAALKQEAQDAKDLEASERCSKYALWAALLCRRTFAMYVDRGVIMDPEALQTFLECSVALQENLIGDPAGLKGILKRAVIRDTKMTSQLQDIVLQSVAHHPSSLIECISTVWPNIKNDHTRRLGSLKFLPKSMNPGDSTHCWVEVRSEFAALNAVQVIHLHLLEGHFLVMGQPMGRLSAVYRESVTLKALFADQSLLTVPSHLPGMSHLLKVTPNGHEIHLGLRRGRVVVRAIFRGAMLELIPPEKFFAASFQPDSWKNFDIPFSMINNCVHWLDLEKGVVDIRQQPKIWYPKLSNWKLYVRERIAQRRNVTLVNPQSKIFRTVAGIFSNFEYPQNLTVFQPQTRPLSVELKRLELSFTVNKRGWLESRQLRAELNDQQDPGTWYGLSSKLVLTEVIRDPVELKRNPNTQLSIVPSHPRRSIIAPMGDLTYHRQGPHVKVRAENDGAYGIFTIDDTLQRIECQAEPRLLYLKALYHAYTSFVIPDPLTGRTGTEEALHFLSSGICQPWSPLNEAQNRGLLWIEKLTPCREYYPTHLKVMQKTSWDPHLTTNIQHDRFRAIVDGIHKLSDELATFALKCCSLPGLNNPGDKHLNVRSQLRRQSYQRPNSGFLVSARLDLDQTLAYPARHFQKATPARENVLDIVRTIQTWPSYLATTSDLASMLNGCQIIGGFGQEYNSALLSDLLELDFAINWGALVNLCCSRGYEDRFELMFLFALVAFNHTDAEEVSLIRTLLAFAVFGELKNIQHPVWPSYSNFSYLEKPTIAKFLPLIELYLTPYKGDDRAIFENQEFNMSAKQWKQLQSQEMQYLQSRKNDGEFLIRFLLNQWPCQVPSVEGVPAELLVDVPQARNAVLSEWFRIYQNFHLSNYITDVQRVLNRRMCPLQQSTPIFEIPEQDVLPRRVRGVKFLRLSDLLRKTLVPTTDKPRISEENANILDPNTNIQSDVTSPGNLVSNRTAKPTATATVDRPEIAQLDAIVRRLAKSERSVRRQYGEDLGRSLDAFRKLKSTSTPRHMQLYKQVHLDSQIKQARSDAKQSLAQLKENFECPGATESSVQWLQQGGLWPCITPVTLFESLRSTAKTVFGKGMKQGLVTYALYITALQRLFRLYSAHQKGNEQKFWEEWDNVGHTNWQPLHQTDWLLLEIDANLLIRPGQVEVALATIDPSSKSNSVLQMNMGQGKTSCIMPMAAVVLANGKNLMRVIVPKSLLLQTAQLMHSRLGGLLGRKIVHIPFSRKTRTDLDILSKFDAIHQDVRKLSGIVLALPEHILSFKLSGQQQLSDGHIPEAQKMIKIQEWISQVSRDVIDEADSILAIRTQLIYPSGTQKTVDGHPHRWLVAEALLGQVRGHLDNLRHHFPHSIEVVKRAHDGLPFIFFLRKDVEDKMLALLVDDIYMGRTTIIPAEISKSDRLLIKDFISEQRVSSTLADSIDEMLPDKPGLKQVIYLLRGLLVHRILIMALKKRWNVQYGLHPGRDPMAVPFTAKGTPSDQAEWGHPDVAILFTCLAFYYQGLSLEQLRQTLDHVLKSDDPSQVYERLSQDSELPDSLRLWNAINVDDEVQLQELWEPLRYRVVVVDYFLNNHVFPRYAKQFHMKLQASGWDIPLFSADSGGNSSTSLSKVQNEAALTTGFSGTNDWKRMLPLTIAQNDLPRLSHTNAEVLAYLLEPRNRGYVVAADIRGRHLSERDLLLRIKGLGIRVLIDAGAQILEMKNIDLIRAWLDIDTEAPAAVYFADDHKAWVYYRQGHSIPLLASTFADDLSECLVYLDEAHTRGTDLKLPPNARGALTLGLDQTKDHTVQAAMRLRQLGTTQSVIFFAPPQVNQSILDLLRKKEGDPISSLDVICWLIEQTCNGIEQLIPLYYSQGMDHYRRTQACLDNPAFLSHGEQREAYLGSLRQIEQQSLAQLYGLSKKKPIKKPETKSPQLASFIQELYSRRKAFQDSGAAVHGSALQEVEQEREVAYEMEAVRVVQKPVHYTALGFPPIHRDVLSFANTGRLVAGASGYELAFDVMGRTLLGKKYKVNSHATSSRLFVSTEFTRTVKFPARPYDDFQRPVQWIVWSSVCEAALIIIPEEAEYLLSTMSSDQNPRTHIISYAAPVTRRMLHFSKLSYLAMPTLPADWDAPAWLKIELGIYAGRLYFEFSEYPALLSFLGVRCTPGGSIEMDSDADDDDDCINVSPDLVHAKVFTRRPLTFVQEWLAIRRKGQNFDQTPMGFVCQGKVLLESHHFFAKLEGTEIAKKEVGEVAGLSDGNKDGEDGEDDFSDEEGGDEIDLDDLEEFDENELVVVDNFDDHE